MKPGRLYDLTALSVGCLIVIALYAVSIGITTILMYFCFRLFNYAFGDVIPMITWLQAFVIAIGVNIVKMIFHRNHN